MPGRAVGALGVVQGKTPLQGKYNSAQQFSGKGFLVFLLVVPILILQGVCYQLCAFVKWPRVSYTYLNISHSRAILNTFYPFFYIFVMGFGASLPLHLFQSLTKLQQILVLLTFHSRGSGF